jgi:hypothetical protein
MQAYRYRDRKYRATTQLMSITYFKLQDNQTDFRVGVIGARKIPYILDFCQSTMNITCTCPDYEKREHKPLCKHMLFIVNLSNQRNMFNNLTCHDELKDAAKLTQIRESIMAIIDQKKLSAELGESNTVSIERDDFCSICMCDLDEGQIEKCTVCAHVMHIPCITNWWDLSSRWNRVDGKCPYCKDPRGFFHIRQNAEDPWHNFDFSNGSEAPVAAPEEAPVDAPEEAPVDAPIVVPVQIERPLYAQNFVTNIINVMRDDIVYNLENSNIDESYLPNIQSLLSRLNLLQQDHDAIQNAFQAQPE